MFEGAVKRVAKANALKTLTDVHLHGVRLRKETLFALLLPSKVTLRRLTLNYFDMPMARILSRRQPDTDWITKEFRLEILRITDVDGKPEASDIVIENGVGRMAPSLV